MNHLSSTCQRLYAELLQASLRGAAPSGRGLSFVSKHIGGRKHWYVQLTVGSRKTQHYLGPDREDTRTLIAEEKRLWAEATPELAERRRLVSLVTRAGAITPTVPEARVLEVLERTGVFRVGGALVGSMAFRLYGNMLGCLLAPDTATTEDVDVAQDNQIPVAVGAEPQDLRAALRQSGLGFVEVPALNRKSPSTSFKIRGQQFSVDILTPMRGRTNDKPVHVPSLDMMATPVRFLDYLLDDLQPAAVVASAGILVNVPAPGRYALHKLVLSRRRPAAWQAKATKDLAQAHELLAILLETRPDDISMAYEAAMHMPATFTRALTAGIRQLPDGMRSALAPFLPARKT